MDPTADRLLRRIHGAPVVGDKPTPDHAAKQVIADLIRAADKLGARLIVNGERVR